MSAFHDDPLHKPLGLAPATGDRPRRRMVWPALALTASFAALGATGASVVLTRQAPQQLAQAPSAARVDPEPTSSTAPAPATPGQIQTRNAVDMESESGVVVHRSPSRQRSNALIIQVPESARIRLEPAPEQRVSERTPQGVLPKIGADGSRPSEIYARPVLTGAALKAGAPRIALYVGGLGLDPAATNAAITRLPPAVTLAFAPYGATLARDAAAAREEGHEILLQAPMEPLGPGDAGPQALLASDASKTAERLRWQMTRFPGYIGIASYLGGRFTAEEAALAPVLKEIAKRGLIYVEDGAAPRSQGARLAAGLALPMLRADLIVDRIDRPEAIDAALAELEKIAREKGVAIGAASALPSTLARLQPWTRTLETRGIGLVPLSAAAQSAAVAAKGR